MKDTDLILVMDADSTLNPDFIENALRYIKEGFHAVGGVFLGKEGGGFVGMLQRNEYARYARDVKRMKGKTLVLTGTATLFTAKCLKDVVKGRECGKIPGTGETSYVYDIKALTEDNELTFALRHLGYGIIAPEECGLKTEVMNTWGDLYRQRFRWKRGAIENNAHYGLTRVTWPYWARQFWSLIGVLVMLVYVGSMAYSFAIGEVHLHPIWIAVTLIFILQQAVTVARRGPTQVLLAMLLVIEMPYDIYLQLVHGRAFLASCIRSTAKW